MNKQSRIERYREFKQFLVESESIFTNLSNKNKRFKEFANYYNLCICPGGSMGGADERVLEVFYGQRPFDVKKKDPFDRQQLRVLTESGARLHYNLLDNGMVLLVLYPAKTENFAPVENSITISKLVDPSRLIKLSEHHFEILNSYMICTSLDGDPNIREKFKTFWIRFTNHLIEDGKNQPKKILTAASEIFKYTLTVGFSGFLLFLLTMLSSPAYKEEIDFANKKLSSIEKRVDEIDKQEVEINRQSSEVEKLLGQIKNSIKENLIRKIPPDLQKKSPKASE